jgi:hypothetical protein
VNILATEPAHDDDVLAATAFTCDRGSGGRLWANVLRIVARPGGGGDLHDAPLYQGTAMVRHGDGMAPPGAEGRERPSPEREGARGDRHCVDPIGRRPAGTAL